MGLGGVPDLCVCVCVCRGMYVYVYLLKREEHVVRSSQTQLVYQEFT